MQVHRAFKGLHVLPTAFTNIASMSKMSNIYFSTCESQGEAKMHAKTVYNKSESCSAIFLSFAPRVTYKCFRIRLQEFVACPAANSLTVTLHELYRVWSLSSLVQFSLAYPPTNACLCLSLAVSPRRKGEGEGGCDQGVKKPIICTRASAAPRAHASACCLCAHVLLLQCGCW